MLVDFSYGVYRIRFRRRRVCPSSASRDASVDSAVIKDAIEEDEEDGGIEISEGNCRTMSIFDVC